MQMSNTTTVIHSSRIRLPTTIMMNRNKCFLFLLLASFPCNSKAFFKKGIKELKQRHSHGNSSNSSNSSHPFLSTSSSSSSSSFDHDPSVLYNFHKNRPIVPNVREALQDLELHASDEYIHQILDQVLDRSLYSSDIILQYKPHRSWLWRQWHGTILPHSLTKIFVNMTLSAVLCWMLGRRRNSAICGTTPDMPWWRIIAPSESCVWVSRLKVLDKLWHYQMQLTTFILTFFVGQAYALWREMYATGRKIQGRLNDIGILLATHVHRNSYSDNNHHHQDEQESSSSSSSQQPQLPPQSVDFLQTVARHIRLFTILFWASQSRQFKVLLTRRGMYEMQQAGILTSRELQTLLKLPVSPTQRHNAVLQWIMMECLQARRQHSDDGALSSLLPDSTELFKLLLEKCIELRATCAGVGDLVAGRMPLAYTHFVQVLVDSFLLAAPLALYAELGSLSILCVGMMTLFYEGLLDLAKVFLDPLNNEDFCEGGIDMDLGVLVRETNASSLRWMNGASVLPV